VLKPEQKLDVVAETETDGTVFTVIATVVVPVHPLTAVPVTVYVVEVVGFAVTEDPVTALSPVEGDHAYEAAPETRIDADPPLQKLFPVIVEVTLTTSTVTETLFVTVILPGKVVTH
jgi:hypothetical protein